MKAVVLTCDRYSAFRNHMISSYMKLWSDIPFHFLIPYQDERFRNAPPSSPCTFVQTSSDIKQCVLQLLALTDDDEWIYWSIDDKYPIWLDAEAVGETAKQIIGTFDKSISGFLMCRPEALWKTSSVDHQDNLSFCGVDYLRRRSSNHIWIHQFVRSRIIKRLFQSFPNEPFPPKRMDEFVKRHDLLRNERLFVSRRSYVVFGESTTRGKITKNCMESMTGQNIKIPDDFTLSNKRQIIGERRMGDYFRRLSEEIFIRRK